MAASLAYRAAQGSVVLGVVHGGLTLASFISSFPVSARVTPVGEGTQPQVQTDPTQHTRLHSLDSLQSAQERELGNAITKLWLGGSFSPVMFRPDVVFEDPCARCEGRREVQEAFRAFYTIRGGISLSPPRVEYGSKPGEVILYLHHQYRFANRDLEMRTQLLMQMDNEGRVYSLEERWEQLPLLSVAQISRRINGFLSCTFSPFLL